jgi:HAD superfamily hydrolase (TIGR01509 family)
MPPLAAPVRALLFDFDGVLADTEPLHWRAWREVLKPYGIELDWETFRKICVGLSDSEMLNKLCGLATKPVTSDELRAHYPQKREIFRALADGQPLIDAGVMDLIKSIRSLRLGVVTSSNKFEVEPILIQGNLLDHLAIVIYGNDVRHYKPHPEPYLLALQRLGIPARETIVFEDSAAGLRSAREARCRVVQVPNVARLPALLRAKLSEIFPRNCNSY